MEERESFISGFCRNTNQTRRVVCIYVKEGDSWRMDEMDCCFGSCGQEAACEIARQARAECPED